MDKKYKRDIWCHREVHEMLSIINEKHVMQLIDGKAKRNKTIYVDIAKELKKRHQQERCANSEQI